MNTVNNSRSVASFGSMVKHSMKWQIASVVSLVVVAGAVGGSVWGYNKLNKNDSSSYTSSTSSLQATSSASQTPQLNTYKSDIYDISFKYSNDWKVVADKHDFTCDIVNSLLKDESSCKDKFTIEWISIENPKVGTIAVSYDFETWGTPAGPTLPAPSEFTTKVLNVQNTFELTYMKQNKYPTGGNSKLSKIYITLVPYMGTDNSVDPKDMLFGEARNEEAKKVLESFTFNTDPYVGWKTYENQTYGYSIKYPSDWSLFKDNADNKSVNNTGSNIPGIQFSKNGYIFMFIQRIDKDYKLNYCNFADNGGDYMSYGESEVLASNLSGYYRRNQLPFNVNEPGAYTYMLCYAENNDMSYADTLLGDDNWQVSYFTPQHPDPRMVSTMDLIFGSLERL